LSGALPKHGTLGFVTGSEKQRYGRSQSGCQLSTVSALELKLRRRFFEELTVQAVINDPLIELVNRADCVDGRSFAQLIESAARVLGKRTADETRQNAP